MKKSGGLDVFVHRQVEFTASEFTQCDGILYRENAASRGKG